MEVKFLTIDEINAKLTSGFSPLKKNDDLSKFSEATIINEFNIGKDSKNKTETVISDEEETLPDITTDMTASSFLEVLQQNTANSNSHVAQFTTAISNQNKLLKEQNDLNAERNNLLKEQLKFQSLQISLERERNEILNTNTNTNALLVSENTNALSNIGTALENANFAPTVNNNIETPTVTNKIEAPIVNSTVNNTIDTSSIAKETAKIATATVTIASGVESQIETNTKINDKLDFDKNGVSTLIGSDDKQISPRIAKAIHDYEKGIETKDMNITEVSEFMDYVDFGLGVVDEGASALGIEDGITLDFNPIEYVVELLEDLMKEELEKEGYSNLDFVSEKSNINSGDNNVN